MKLLLNEELVRGAMHGGDFDADRLTLRFSHKKSFTALYDSLRAKFGKPLYEDGVIAAFRI